MAGAACSTGSIRSGSIGDPSSSALPSGSMMRPSRPSPTGTRTTAPVPRTRLPAPTCAASPSRKHPARSGDRSVAIPLTPPSKIRISSRRVSARPETQAIPSPTSSTLPKLSATARGSSSASRWGTDASQSSTLSSSVPIALQQHFKRLVEALFPTASNNRVRQTQFDAGDQIRILGKVDLQFASEHGLDPLAQRVGLERGQRSGAGHLQSGFAQIGSHLPALLRRHFLQHPQRAIGQRRGGAVYGGLA